MFKRTVLLSIALLVLVGASRNAVAYWAHDYEWDPASDFVDVRYHQNRIFMLGKVQHDPRYAMLVAESLGGAFLWSKWIGPMDRGACCLEVVDDGLVVVGHNSAEYDPTYNAVVVTKLDFGGGFMWSRAYEVPDRNNVYARDIVVANKRHVVIAGDLYSYNTSNLDSWVMRLDELGNVMWQYTYYHNDSTQERAMGIDALGDGELFIVSSNWQSPGSSNNFWVMELLPNGDYYSYKDLYPPMRAYLREVKYVTPNRNYALTGYIYHNAHRWDILALMDYPDPYMPPQWSKRFGVYNQALNDIGFDLVQSHNDDLIIAGYSIHPIFGNAYGALLRLRWWDGMKLCERHLGGQDHHDLFTALDRTEDRDFAVVGWNRNFGPSAPQQSAWGMSLDTCGGFPGNWCVDETYDMHSYDIDFKYNKPEVGQGKPDLKDYDFGIEVFDKEPFITYLCP